MFACFVFETNRTINSKRRYWRISWRASDAKLRCFAFASRFCALFAVGRQKQPLVAGVWLAIALRRRYCVCCAHFGSCSCCWCAHLQVAQRRQSTCVGGVRFSRGLGAFAALVQRCKPSFAHRPLSTCDSNSLHVIATATQRVVAVHFSDTRKSFRTVIKLFFSIFLFLHT